MPASCARARYAAASPVSFTGPAVGKNPTLTASCVPAIATPDSAGDATARPGTLRPDEPGAEGGRGGTPRRSARLAARAPPVGVRQRSSPAFRRLGRRGRVRARLAGEGPRGGGGGGGG